MVLNRFLSVLIIILFLCIQNCDWFDEVKVPDTPLWVKKSLPVDSIENGIDAEPLENSIFMHWHPVRNKNLEGYKIYRSEIKDPLDDSIKEEFKVITKINIYHNPEYDTVFVDEDVKLNYFYRYIIRSFNYDGVLSEPSDTIEYSLIPKASLVSPREGMVNPVRPEFKWRNGTRVNQLVLRLESFPSRKIIWLCKFQNNNYTNEITTLRYNNVRNYPATLNSLVPGQQYRWRIDLIAFTNGWGADVEGSESLWQYFTVSE